VGGAAFERRPGLSPFDRGKRAKGQHAQLHAVVLAETVCRVASKRRSAISATAGVAIAPVRSEPLQNGKQPRNRPSSNNAPLQARSTGITEAAHRHEGVEQAQLCVAIRPAPTPVYFCDQNQHLGLCRGGAAAPEAEHSRAKLIAQKSGIKTNRVLVLRSGIIAAQPGVQKSKRRGACSTEAAGIGATHTTR